MRTLTIVLAAALSACATSTGSNHRLVQASAADIAALLADKPAGLGPHYRHLFLEGRRNEVLNNLRIGVAAVELGEFAAAEKAFDAAIARIAQVYANDESARQARSLWYSEDVKDFLGEPYERAMAYYYRGLLFLRAGDHQNARAAFRAGLLQDSLAEEKQHTCDFAALLYLQGWAARLAGDTAAAERSFAEAKQLRPDLEIPAADHDTLVIAELGTAPRKVLDGLGQEKLVYRAGKGFSEVDARLVGAVALPLYPIEDVAWQAATRGGRMVDYILADKMVFRQQTTEQSRVLSAAAQSTVLAGTLPGAGSELGGVGAGIAALSGIMMLVANNAKTRADDRCWNNLPNSIHVATCRLPDAGDVEVEFLDADGRRVGEPRPPRLRTSSPGALVWVRSRSALAPLQGVRS